jgi:dihydropyrimidinase
MPILIRRGTVVNHDHSRRADVLINGGRIAWKDGDLRAKAGDGDFVRRDPYPSVHVANSTWREINRPRAVKRAGAVTP